MTYYGAKKPDDFRGQDLGRPLPTQTTENRFGLVAPVLSRQFGQSIGQSVDAPHPTITQCNHDALITANLVKMRGTNIGAPVDEPLRTVSAQGQHHALIEAACIAKHYGGVVGHEIDKPLGTVTSIDHHSLVSACLTKYYGKSDCSSIDDPMHTITAKARMGLVEAEARKDSELGRYEQVRDFLRTWGVIGPEDEAEFVYQGVAYRITDILMRMLAPRELYTAQGFLPDYIIDRLPDGKRLTKTAQIRMCGNSVPPELIETLVRANASAVQAASQPALPLLEVA